MFDDHALAFPPALVAATTTLFVGIAAWWANPGRTVNRFFLSASIHVAAWLLFLHMAITASDGQVWVRAASSVGGLLPLHLWFLKESVIGENLIKRYPLWRMVAWLLLSTVLFVIPTTEWYIPAHSHSGARVYGRGYYAYIGLVVIAYGTLFRDTLQRIRTQTGGQRLELQVLLVGGTITALTVIGLMIASAITHSRLPILFQPIVVMAFYTLTVVLITTHRVFDARYLISVCGQKAILILLTAGGAFGADMFFRIFIPEPLAFIITTGAVLGFAAELNGWLDKRFGRFPKASQVRSAIIAAETSQRDRESLRIKLEEIVAGWAKTEAAYILVSEEDGFKGGTWTIPTASHVGPILRRYGWITPERLSREKVTREGVTMREFLKQYSLGAIVVVRGATLQLAVAVSVRASRRPFTYPEILQLQELALSVEGSLARMVFVEKAQRAQQLATVGLVGAGVAHEIRNPLVTIKTFIQLLPTHYHDERFRTRFTALIADEVGRIDKLTEQLLDLAAPKSYEAQAMSLSEVAKPALELIETKACEKGVTLHVSLLAVPDVVLTDANAVKQVLLNLCFNAMQAQEGQEREKWVRVETRKVSRGIELAISDNGPGIAAEMRPRLFEAFQTTKSSGFGLGLAICREVLTGVNATISVDPYEPGRGATFRVILPCPPLSS